MAMRRRKSSPLWDHFSEDEIEPKKAKCKYCSQKISFTSGSLANLSRHLKRKHVGISTSPIERQADKALPLSAPDSTPAESGIVTIDIDTDVSCPRRDLQPKTTVQQKIYGYTETTKPISQQKKSKIDNQLIVMIAKEYHPLRLVEEPEFGKLLALLCPSYRLPTRKTLSETLLPQLCLKLEQEVQAKIENAPAVCLTTDAWTSINNQSFIAVTAHYISEKDAQLCSNLLGCIEYGGRHTSANLCTFLKEQVIRWKIETKIGAVVSDNAANILLAVQQGNWRSIGCYAHLINLTVQASIEHVSETVQKVKAVVEFFKRSSQAMYKLNEFQKQMDLPILKLKQDVPTRWNSTFDMLDRVLKIKNAVVATLAILKNDLSLKSEDWEVIENIVPILKIFSDVTVEISSEKNVSLSKVIVYCKLLKRRLTKCCCEIETQSLSNEKQTPNCVKLFLKTLNEQTQKRFNNLEKNPLYAEATILDPRFKNRGFREEANFKTAYENLKTKVSAQHNQTTERSGSTPGCASVLENVAPSTSRAALLNSKPYSIWDDFDAEVSKLVPQNTTAAGIVELENYIKEPLQSREKPNNPLHWWNERKFVYPILYKYMLKRLNLVATSVPCERTFSKAGLIQTDRRSRLSSKKVSQLLFISSNL